MSRIDGGLAAVTTWKELAQVFQYRVGRRGEVGVDALHVAQDVEMERAGLDALDASSADTRKMRLGRARLHIAKLRRPAHCGRAAPASCGSPPGLRSRRRGPALTVSRPPR